MPVTAMTLRFGPTPKPRPKIGDTKTRKDGVEVIRRQCYTRQGGQWMGLVRGSRPVCEWVPVGTPNPWEK